MATTQREKNKHQIPISAEPAARPFVKWVGGKRQLLPDLRSRMPKAFARYYEPFVGGGALFFSLQPPRAVLSDDNAELIEAYTVIREDVESLIQALKSHVYEKAYYYRIRAVDPQQLTEVERAARLIFLNKTGYNGLYRVNRRGGFNVPFGRYRNPTICDEVNLRRVSAVLQTTELRCASFTTILKWCRKGDFVYMDPPYIPLSSTSNFVAYQKSGFGMTNQERLADVFDELHQRGCYLMLSNSDVPWMRERFNGYVLHEIQALRSVNANGHDRGPVPELIVTNYATSD